MIQHPATPVEALRELQRTYREKAEYYRNRGKEAADEAHEHYSEAVRLEERAFEMGRAVVRLEKDE